MPECSNVTADGLNGDDLENEFNIFGTSDIFEDDMDMSEIFNELVDSDTESESEKKDESGAVSIGGSGGGSTTGSTGSAGTPLSIQE